MLKNKLMMLSTFLICGCATSTPLGIKTVIQKVEVPISVPCKVDIPLPPAFNFDKLGVNDDIFSKVQALAADRLLHLGYESQLTTTLNSCIK